MTTASRGLIIITVVWLLVVSLITVAIFEHGQAIVARASVSESVVLMDRALLEIVRSDSAVVRTLRFGTQASSGGCELLADALGHSAFIPENLKENNLWTTGPIMTR
jgi:hypothetical protein